MAAELGGNLSTFDLMPRMFVAGEYPPRIEEKEPLKGHYVVVRRWRFVRFPSYPAPLGNTDSRGAIGDRPAK
jgi:hypothetical protein